MCVSVCVCVCVCVCLCVRRYICMPWCRRVRWIVMCLALGLCHHLVFTVVCALALTGVCFLVTEHVCMYVRFAHNTTHEFSRCHTHCICHSAKVPLGIVVLVLLTRSSVSVHSNLLCCSCRHCLVVVDVVIASLLLMSS